MSPDEWIVAAGTITVLLFMVFTAPCNWRAVCKKIALFVGRLITSTGIEMSSKVVGTAVRPPAAGKGRVKGVPNKTTALLKDAILKAAEAAGEDLKGKNGLIGYCTFLAKEEPKAFSQLLGKVMPMQVVGGDDEQGNPTAIQINIVDPRG